MKTIWREDLNAPADPLHCCWGINAPWAHPVWSQYLCTLYDIVTPTSGVCTATVYLPGATHEMILYALASETVIVPERPLGQQRMAMLRPYNYGYQFIAESDEAARERIERIMESIDEERVSPDTDWRGYWDTHLFPDAFPLVTNGLRGTTH